MLLSEINRYGKMHNIPLVLDDTLKLLCDTINSHGCKKILEIGTAIGYSAIAMASSCDIEKIISVEIDTERYKLAKINISKMHMSDKIDAINIDAGKYIKNCKEKFDFIFLDGPKGQYITYLPYLMNLLDKGGIIFADNIYFHGMVDGTTPTPKSVTTLVRNLQKYNEAVRINDQLDTTFYDIGDGVAISIKK